MKKMIIAALVLSSISAFAGTSVNLSLKGTVAPVNELSIVADTTVSEALNITGGTTGAKVATLTEKSNDKNGYDIMMSSTNGGVLKHSVDSTKTTSYQLSIGSGSMVTPTTTLTPVKFSGLLSGLTTSTSDIKINVRALPNAVAGEYNDTVTFSLVAR